MRLFGRPPCAPQHGADTGHQLLQAERFGHVVVAAQSETADLVVGRVAGRQEQHGQRRRLRSHTTGHLEAIEVRQHDVQHHQVGLKRVHRVQRLAPGVRHRHLELLITKRQRDEVGDALLVVDHKDLGLLAHLDPPLSPRAALSACAPPNVLLLCAKRLCLCCGNAVSRRGCPQSLTERRGDRMPVG